MVFHAPCGWWRRIGVMVAPRWGQYSCCDRFVGTTWMTHLISSDIHMITCFIFQLCQKLAQAFQSSTAQSHMKPRKSASWADLTEEDEASILRKDKGEKHVELRMSDTPDRLDLVPIRKTEVHDETPVDEGSMGECRPCWMWVFEQADPTTVKSWGRRGPWFQKSGAKSWLWWAEVAPTDRSTFPCARCKKSAADHEPDCSYVGQIPCSWCNMYPCKHAAGGKCSRRNFSCAFCHYSATGHCVGNSHDVNLYQLDGCWY